MKTDEEGHLMGIWLVLAWTLAIILSWGIFGTMVALFWHLVG